jgi:hypothetical protein
MMWLVFFAQAMQSPGRQQTFRRAVIVHVLVLAACAFALQSSRLPRTAMVATQVILVAGIVEGAVLIGWRLTQMPKSQALEFLLVSPLLPRRVFWAEAAVGLGRLALVTLSGLPILAWLVVSGHLFVSDLLPLLIMPFTWGAVTGLGLTTWAYESVIIRRWGEQLLALLIILYLSLGVLVGENLRRWLSWLPAELSRLIQNSFEFFHRFNPFAVLQYWMDPRSDLVLAWDRFWALEYAALAVLAILMARPAFRLKGHFHERHYRPIRDDRPSEADRVGDRPLSWWAVRRVMEYSGRLNLWLAGGFGLLFAAYTVAKVTVGWPDWLGQRVFQIFEQAGGIPAISTALVVLAAVPAAFQYGLWDSNVQDRCRRLELLLLTGLDARDYWNAAAAAAWRRGRGYFLIALVLWSATALARGIAAGQPADSLAGATVTAEEVRWLLVQVSAGLVLWGLYFALGFRAFSRGLHANGLGSLLTLGLPLVTFALFQLGLTALAVLTPPGFVYAAAARQPVFGWLPGIALSAAATVLLARWSLRHCLADLRAWYDEHHGRKVLN